MEPIEVTAHFNQQGAITPLHFTWKGGRYRVESTGRHWQDDNGQHMLVMVASGQIYQLTFRSDEGRWYIGQAGPNRVAV
jgi:hypothetical protein